MSNKIPFILAILCACSVPDEAHDPIEATGTGETGGQYGRATTDDGETGADDDGNDLTCSTPGQFVEVEIQPGLCTDCTCGIHGVLVDCSPEFHPC